MQQKSKAFSLIELLIALAIVSTLVSIAYPSYSHYLVRSKRHQAKIMILSLASKLEEYHSRKNTYAGANTHELALGDESKNYQFVIDHTNEEQYLIHAIPNGNQATEDITCGTLSINEKGEQMISGTGKIATCW